MHTWNRKEGAYVIPVSMLPKIRKNNYRPYVQFFRIKPRNPIHCFPPIREVKEDDHSQ